MTTVDEEKIRGQVKKAKPVHIPCHWVQQSTSSGIAPSAASDTMPTTSNAPGSEATWVRFTNNGLPVLFLKERKWTKRFQTTLLLWLGDQPNIWAVPEDNLIHTL